MVCWKRCSVRKYRLNSNGLDSTPSELVLATRDCVVISNDDGGGEQDTTMTAEKWRQSIPLSRKATNEDGKQPASSSSSETSDVRKPPIGDDEVIVNQLATMEAGEMEENGIPPPSVTPAPPAVRAQSPIISAFIDQRLEQLRQQYRDLDSVQVFAEEGECTSTVSLNSSCSYQSKGSEYTLERLRKAGPEFQRFAGLLEMLKVDEDEGEDLESRLVHTGLTQTQGSQSQSQGGAGGPGTSRGTGFYF